MENNVTSELAPDEQYYPFLLPCQVASCLFTFGIIVISRVMAMYLKHKYVMVNFGAFT